MRGDRNRDAPRYDTFTGQADWIEKTGKGGWFADGAFDPGCDYRNAAPGSITRAVRRFVWLRRNDPDFTPAAAAELIAGRKLTLAFPRHRLWIKLDRVRDWPRAPISTSSESAVKYTGLRDSTTVAGPDF